MTCRLWLALLLCWTVAAVPLRAKDGDTVVVRAYVWPSGVKGSPVSVPETIRALGVNAPELHKAASRAAGQAAWEYTIHWLALDGPRAEDLTVTVCSEERDAFGRLLGRITRVRDGADLAADLVRDGHAVPFKP